MNHLPTQGLLKRHPKLSRREFSEAWERHGRLVAPWFIKYGITYYAQIHEIRLATATEDNANEPLNIAEWDGAAEAVFSASGAQDKEWRETDPVYEGYLQDVIRADERRFLVSEALMHIKTLKPGTVEGRKVVIIADGRIQVDIPQEIMEDWNRWNKH